jgi:hypothetical protein
MSAFTLRLIEDQLYPEATGIALPPLNRVLYVREGEIAVIAEGAASTILADKAWYGATACTLDAGSAGATLLRYELVGGGGSPLEAAGIASSRTLLAQPIDLDPAERYLMRCDRVDFAPGAVALPHGHKGGGIRCLVQEQLDVSVGDHPARTMRPGDAWYESGREPVLAVASPELPTSFVGVSILPAAIRGQSSIQYVDAAGATRSSPRSYTVHVDEPIELP